MTAILTLSKTNLSLESLSLPHLALPSRWGFSPHCTYHYLIFDYIGMSLFIYHASFLTQVSSKQQGLGLFYTISPKSRIRPDT